MLPFKLFHTYFFSFLLTIGLANSTTKEDVEQLFSKFGIVKDVRLATFKTGVPKGTLVQISFQ